MTNPDAGCGCGCEADAETAHVCTCGGHGQGSAGACACGGHGGGDACACSVPAAKPKLHGCSGPLVKTPRRIHAASGLVFALFLLVHLLANSVALENAAYGQVVGWIHAVIDALPGITLVLVFLPLSIQIVTGAYLLYKNSLYYTVSCNRGNSLRFFLQRASGLAILVFVAVHLGMLHGWGTHGVLRAGGAILAGYDPAHLFFPGILGTLCFLIGILAAVYHMANGAITGTHVWGLINAPQARVWLRRVCAGGGVALAGAASLAWFAFLGHGLLPGA